MVNRNINEVSGFRTTPDFILGAEYIPPEASYVPQLLSEMLYRDRTESFVNNIYERVAAMHISFERIHPFSDGNAESAGTYDGLAEHVEIPEQVSEPEGPGTEEETGREDSSVVLPVVDFEALRENEPDIIGWLNLPDTAIN